MIEEYEIRVTRAWVGVKGGQVIKVPKRRAEFLVRGGFAELVEKANKAAPKKRGRPPNPKGATPK